MENVPEERIDDADTAPASSILALPETSSDELLGRAELGDGVLSRLRKESERLLDEEGVGTYTSSDYPPLRIKIEKPDGRTVSVTFLRTAISREDAERICRESDGLVGAKIEGDGGDFAPRFRDTDGRLHGCLFTGTFGVFSPRRASAFGCEFFNFQTKLLAVVVGPWDRCRFDSSEIKSLRLERAKLRELEVERTAVSEFASDTPGTRNTSVFERCLFRKSEIQSGSLVSASFEYCDFEDFGFGEVELHDVKFPDSELLDCDFMRAHLSSRTDFSGTRSVAGSKITKLSLEGLVDAGGLTTRQLQSLEIIDPIAQLRLQFGGFVGLVHSISVAMFLYPYAFFILKKHWGAGFSTCVGNCEPLLLSMWKFLYTGGHFDGRIHWESVGPFLLLTLYNAARVILLWKTKSLEHHEAVRGVPDTFQLSGKWRVLYEVVRLGFLVNLGLALIHTGIFLWHPVPVT